MQIVFSNIKYFLSSFNGVFLLRNRTIDNDLRDLYESIFSPDYQNNDHVNIKNDMINIYKDINKSLNLYKAERLGKNK